MKGRHHDNKAVKTVLTPRRLINKNFQTGKDENNKKTAFSYYIKAKIIITK